MKYKPNHFLNPFDKPIGPKIWEFLTREDNLIRLETASELKRPAVEAISTRLVKKFGDEVRQDRIKQMIGHMTRQIMEARGFALTGQNFKIRVGDLFSRGSKYHPLNK